MLSCSSEPTVSNAKPSKPGQAANKEESETEDLSPRGVDYSQVPEKIAFGSCANQDQPEPIWKTILQDSPDLFLFMGDTVYASSPAQQPIGDQYKKLSQIPEFKIFREKIPIMATWDDNDFGTNDGGADSPSKFQARREFLQFWPYVKDAIPFQQEGVFHSKILGGLVTGKKRRLKINGPSLQVIMLDTRTYRSSLEKNPDPAAVVGPYVATKDTTKTILGEEQWTWLEEQLKRPANFRILVSSIQVIPTEHGFEKWANFPHERLRLFQLLKKLKITNLVILSGDRHFAAISQAELKGAGNLLEITSSSLNRPGTLQEEKDPAYQSAIYNKENYGLASFDWKKKTAKFEIKDLQGKVVQSAVMKF